MRDFREAHPEEEFTLAMQAMQDGADTRELVSYLDDYMDEDDSGLLAEVDSVRVHVLKHSLSALRKLEHGKKSDAISELLEAVRSDRELMDFDPEDEVEVYFSAWTATANDVEADLALPMSSAIATISMFTGMAELGTDLAAGWGFGMEELGTHVTKSWLDPETGELRLSPHGEVFRQMAETLPGMKMLSHRQIDACRDIQATYYAFTDESKAAIFLAANDIPDDGLEIEFDLSDFADFAGFEVESVSVPDGWAGEPVVSTPDLSIDGARLTVRLTSDYQVIRIIGHYEEPEDEDDAQAENDDDDPATGHAGDDGTESNTRDDGSLNIRGTEGDDTLSGSGLGDRMQGGPGDDRLFGGAGNDELFGGWGNDTIRGGTGDDALHLGMGQDHAWGGSGGDIFHVDVRAEAILHDFTAEDGDRIDFGGAYETAEDLLAVSSRGDYGGSGENRDLFLTHAAGGVTVLLGGASLWPDLPDLVLDVAETQPVTYTPIAPPLGGGDDVMLPHDPDRERQDAEEESDEDEDEEEDEGASASQGTCFVATAAFGDRMHPDVVWLRNWRDTVLVSTAPGRAFIRFYWKVGPVMARYVRSDRPSGRFFRKIITGIIRSLRCFWRA